MAEPPYVAAVEIVQLEFHSWEHRWLTSERAASSIATARRLLPDAATAPIYEILLRWEREMLRETLPFSPYGLRLKPKNCATKNEMAGDEVFFEALRRAQPLNAICPNWDAALPQPAEKKSKFGEMLRTPLGDDPIRKHYHFEWRRAVFPTEIKIDTLLGRFSPRYQDPPIYPSFA